jgi:sigma-E factor negative regulatory protein RseB
MLRQRRACGAVAGLALVGVAFTAPAEDAAPADWLNRMARAVQTTDYEGTVIRFKEGSVAQVLKVVHVVTDGVVHERFSVQEGNGLEIIRNGNEVQCILPDKQSVLVGEWDNQSTLFSTLPSSDVRFGNEYDVRIVREERVAGRKALVVAIQPHDDYRFGHRLWLDLATAFPLQTQLIGVDGDAIEAIKFVDIALDRDIDAGELQPTYDTAGFRWVNEPRRRVSRAVASDWVSGDLPAGFRLLATHEEEVPGSTDPVTHMLFSDGLANVSVFVEPDNGNEAEERSGAGASNSFSVAIGGYRVTAVGEVPAPTVEKIARSMRFE